MKDIKRREERGEKRGRKSKRRRRERDIPKMRKEGLSLVPPFEHWS